MLKKTAPIVLSTALLAFSNSALAAMPTATGMLFGFGAGLGKVNETISGAKDNNDGFAGTLYGGYKFNKNLASEIGYMGYSNAHYKTAGVRSVEAEDNYAVYLSIDGIYPLEDGFSLFGKIGPAYAHSDIRGKNGFSVSNSGNHSEFVAYGALGVDYAVNTNVSVIAQAAGTTKTHDVPGMYQGTLGLQVLV